LRTKSLPSLCSTKSSLRDDLESMLSKTLSVDKSVLSRTGSLLSSDRGSRLYRTIGGRWPEVHRSDGLGCPAGRVRTLICNWPSHFCKDSLIRVPAGAEPVQAPFTMTVCHDLRARKEELRTKKAYLVAYDAERLRKCGAGMGINPIQAADSFISQDCVCSEMVPIRRLYGEATITLQPPSTSDGDVFVLLRIVTVSDPNNMQDWCAIGDPVAVRVEPRKTRYDKTALIKLKEELASLEGLQEFQQERRTHEEAGVEMSAALCIWQATALAESRALSETEAAGETMWRKMEESRNTCMELDHLRIRTRLTQEECKEEVEAARNTATQRQIALERLMGEAKALKEAGLKAQAVLVLRSALDDSHKQQVFALEKQLEEREAALDITKRELEASESEAHELRESPQAEIEEAKKQAVEDHLWASRSQKALRLRD